MIYKKIGNAILEVIINPIVYVVVDLVCINFHLILTTVIMDIVQYPFPIVMVFRQVNNNLSMFADDFVISQVIMFWMSIWLL